ncbi:MAG: hypothetical protein KatS3mg002_0368 [Candidatus Woesearchaeota archaeon]|nr:MAG: hypothetical protein KatS3mg002_0368 [Candidatus Woesearchaeota archaeon]
MPSTITSSTIVNMVNEYKEKIKLNSQSIYKLNTEIEELQNKRDELVNQVMIPNENEIQTELQNIRDQMNIDWNNTHDATEGVNVWYIDYVYYDKTSTFGGTTSKSQVDKWAIVRDVDTGGEGGGGTTQVVGYAYNGGSGPGWDNNQTLLNAMNEWNLTYDQITHPIDQNGTYGIDANITKKQELITQLETENTKLQSFVDQFENKVVS